MSATATVAGSAELAAAIRGESFAHAAATVVGYGAIGRHHVDALRALGVGRIRVVSRSAEPLAALAGQPSIETVAGGVEEWTASPDPEDVGIIATPIALSLAGADHLAALGFRRLLIEKPIALRAEAIDGLARRLRAAGVEAVCAYNRLAYPSLCELRARVEREGGVTSCVYTATELIQPDWPQKYPAENLARWGIANSIHVLSLAHGLIGPPARWQAHRSGALPWHPSGRVFVGSGVSEAGVPFAFHADWGSTGRWSVEAHTAEASYRMCPLEQLERRAGPRAPWEPVAIEAFAPACKAGLVEQLAALWSPTVRALLPLASIDDAAALTRYAESIFGYDAAAER